MQEELKFQVQQHMGPADFGRLFRDTVQLRGKVIKDYIKP